MIGAKREAASSSGAALSVIGGGNDPGQSIPSGVNGDYIVEFARLHEVSGFDMALVGYAIQPARCDVCIRFPTYSFGSYDCRGWGQMRSTVRKVA